MRALIDFAALDLRAALDFAIMIEEDAALRYEELARRLGDDAGGAGAVFRAMAVNEAKHRDELLARRAALFRDAAPRIEISVSERAVEGPELDGDELPRTARAALELSLAAEQRAHAFYEQMLPGVADREARAFFDALLVEEAEHVAILARAIAAHPAVEAARAAAPPAGAARLPELAIDLPALRAILPRFDAATQAVAVGVLVEGMAPGDVAAALGVSRRTVSRKLEQFLAVARQHVAGALAAAALAGCSAPDAAPASRTFAPESLRAHSQAPAAEVAATVAPPAPPAPAATTVDERAARDEAKRSSLAARVHAQIAARMPRHDPAVHRSIARAVMAEARLAGLDPLLVLALIHVESSFNPGAVSSAGAVGLMQLRGPTMRREVERSGLPSADPLDPVANVQAGVRYLRRLLDAFGDVDAALMAYNAGPNRIRGHLRNGGIPERFHVYPRKVKGELNRLRGAFDRAAASTLVAREHPARAASRG